jgi:tetratricopeptide (TPR) repeat protein
VRVKHDRAVDDAFALVHDDPNAAVQIATSVLVATDVDELLKVRARWARGMALRERGEMGPGADELFAARQEAVDLGDDVLAARIDTTLALVALYTGSADGAFEILEQARPHLRGADLARLETQRGMIKHRVGDLAAAERDYAASRRHFAGTDDLIGIARLLVNSGILYIQRGDLPRSEECLSEAVTIAQRAGQGVAAAAARHNLGYARSRAGKVSAAIEDLAEAHEQFRRYGRNDLAALVQADRAELLLNSNLLAEALDDADQALQTIRGHGTDTDLADYALLAARCRLAAGHPAEAREAAAESAELLQRQHRFAHLALADSIRIYLDTAAGPDAESGEALAAVSQRLEQFGWSSEAATARVRAGQVLLGAGRVDRAAEVLGGLRVTSNRPAGERAAAYLARGLLAEARCDRRRARTAVRRGLRVVAENQTSLGALEFRTFAAGHGEALVELGSRLAIADHRPSELLERVEATRQMVWLAPRATPPGDEELARMLADLRVVTEDFRAAVGAGVDPTELRRRRVDLEREIRDHTRRAQAGGEARATGVGDAVGTLGDHMLLEYATIDGGLFAVTVAGERARLHELGSTHGLADDVDACTFALHRLNRVQGSTASKEAARATLAELGSRLANRLLPERVRRSARPLVVVPTGPLHGLAWHALPGLAERPVSVSPSLVGWAVALEAAEAGRRGSVLVAAGPELAGARGEVEAVAALYRRPTVLVDGQATGDVTLQALGRSRVAHLACHGAYRSDNPLFSTLTLADGPLTVYDLERVRSMPRTIVLSACSVATSSVLRGGTLLGLASALMTFGASAIVAPLTPVNDERVVSVMTALHRAMVGGMTPAAALAETVLVDGRPDPTAAAFVVLGA